MVHTKVLYPITVHSRLPDEYQISSPLHASCESIDRPWFTAQLSPWLRVLPSAALLPSCLSSPGLFLLAPTGFCPGKRAVPCSPSQTRPTSRSHQQDTGVPTACFSLSPAGPLSCPKPGRKGCSGNSRTCPASSTCSLALRWQSPPFPKYPGVNARNHHPVQATGGRTRRGSVSIRFSQMRILRPKEVT